MQIVRLSNGKVTQNGKCISYKTTNQSKSIELYQAAANEMSTFLDEKGIHHDGVFEAETSYASPTRKGCFTVKVFTKDPKVNALPYEADSIN